MVRSPHLSRIPYRSLFVAVALDPRRIDAAVQHRKDVGDVEYFGSLLYEGMSSDEEAEDADDEADDDDDDEGDGAGAGKVWANRKTKPKKGKGRAKTGKKGKKGGGSKGQEHNPE